MTIDFSGRIVVVTGAGNGLGRVHALEFGRRGANVVVNDLGTSGTGEGASSQDADAVVAEITSEGGTAVASHDSVATDAGCRAIADRAMRSFGRIDAVVHNAGILRNAMFEDLTDDDWSAVLVTHLTGQFFLSRAVWPIMREQQYGRLVFTSSSSGAFGRPFGANYAAAKAGVLGLCNALAIEGQEHGILANAILPSGLTRMSASPATLRYRERSREVVGGSSGHGAAVRARVGGADRHLPGQRSLHANASLLLEHQRPIRPGVRGRDPRMASRCR